MLTATVDNSMGSQLNQFKVPVILFDQTGRKLGQFLLEPMTWEQARIIDGCPHSVEELERMRNETGGRPLAELWKELGRS